MMTIEEFAKKAGCVVSINSDDIWGGKYQYHQINDPRVHFCGYKTERSAYKAFLTETFGEVASKAIISILKKLKWMLRDISGYERMDLLPDMVALLCLWMIAAEQAICIYQFEVSNLMRLLMRQ